MKTNLKKGSMFVLALLLAVFSIAPMPVYAAGELDLYTSYASVAVSPGDNVRYSVEASNPTSAVQTNRLSVSGLPDDWTYTLQASSYSIERISVKPNDTQTVTLNVQVPYLVDRGTYNFSMDVDGVSKLPLSITVSEQGINSSELTVDQPNLQGHSDSDFSFSAELNNQTSETQNYALQAAVDPGWIVEFRASGEPCDRGTK